MKLTLAKGISLGDNLELAVDRAMKLAKVPAAKAQARIVPLIGYVLDPARFLLEDNKIADWLKGVP